MLAKVKFLLTSIRFWEITLGAVSAELAFISTRGFQIGDLLGVVTAWLGSVAAVGTIDKATQK